MFFLNFDFLFYLKMWPIWNPTKKRSGFRGKNALYKKLVSFSSGVGNTWPAGQLRPSKSKSAAHEHTFIFNRMRPTKENKKIHETYSRYSWFLKWRAKKKVLGKIYGRFETYTRYSEILWNEEQKLELEVRTAARKYFQIRNLASEYLQPTDPCFRGWTHCVII